jgi:hypothetical protein
MTDRFRSLDDCQMIKYSKTVEIADLLVFYSRYICNLVVIFAIYLRGFNGRGHDLFAVFAIYSRFLTIYSRCLNEFEVFAIYSRFLQFIRGFCDLFAVLVFHIMLFEIR